MRVDDVVMARVGGRWEESRILHVHPDGTLTVLPLSAPYRFLNDWTGLTAAEVCTDDRWRWSELFWTHAPEGLMGPAEFKALHAAFDLDLPLDAIEGARIGCWNSPRTDYIGSWAPFSNTPTQYLISVDGVQKWYGQ